MKTLTTKTKAPKGPRVFSAALLAKHQPMHAKAIAALRADYSVGQVSRAYDIPQHLVSYWRDQAGIPPYSGKPRPMPDVGAVLA